MESLLHLIAMGHISSDDALAVLDAQRSSRPPIGKIALESGLLRVSQVFEILAHSADSGLRFGEAAIALGLLSEAQLKALLRRQQDLRPSVGELLVELELCDATVLEKLA